MKRAVLIALLLSAPTLRYALAQDLPGSFYSTCESVGRTPDGLTTPANQRVTPTGALVELRGVRPNALALSPDGKILVTAGLTHHVIVLDPVGGQILQRVPFPNPKASLGAEAGSELILNPKLNDKLSYTGIAFSPDGSRIYLSNVNGDLKVFGVGKDNKISPLVSIPLPPVNRPDREMDVPSGIAVSRDGKRIYVALNVSNQLVELDAATGTILRRWNVGVAPFGVVLAQGRAYVSNWGGAPPRPGQRRGPYRPQRDRAGG
jgi:YVTN family beta-propeller protein